MIHKHKNQTPLNCLPLLPLSAPQEAKEEVLLKRQRQLDALHSVELHVTIEFSQHSQKCLNKCVFNQQMNYFINSCSPSKTRLTCTPYNKNGGKLHSKGSVDSPLKIQENSENIRGPPGNPEGTFTTIFRFLNIFRGP